MSLNHEYDVLVAGGGAAGVGAARQAALLGAKVLLVEGGSVLGGTGTLGGVHCWEPGIASAGLNRTLYARLNARGEAFCGRTTTEYSPEINCCVNTTDPSLPYRASLRRGDVDVQVRAHYEPDAMAREMASVLREAGVTVACSTLVLGVRTDGERIVSVTLRDCVTGEESQLRANCFIDSTGDAVLCRAAGVQTRFGEDPASLFGEPCAPEKASGIVNGVSLCFRADPGDRDEPLPAWVKAYPEAVLPEDRSVPVAFIDCYPGGGRNYNPLPLMEGAEYFALPPERRLQVLNARVLIYWDRLKQENHHTGWHLTRIMPRVGVRESWRAVTLETTTEKDLRTGCFRQGDDIVTLADHVLDTHGANSSAMKLPRMLHEPYGIRAGSLIAKEYSNLLVAGRCAGFSHLAASSCRLTRTMMDLGEAAGTIAAGGGDLRRCDVGRVRRILRFEEYLEWVRTDYFRIGTEEN